MTGKELKAWAAEVSDEAVVEARERGYGSWSKAFQIRAVLEVTAKEEPEQEDA